MPILKIKFGDLEFAPGWVATFLTVLLILLFVYLGFWQLGRMDEKKILEQNLKQRMQEEPIQFGEDQGDMIGRDVDSFRFQPLRITGTFLNEHNILLDNKIFKGRAGYNVITPFLSSDTKKLILIDRGWISWGDDRNELPEIKPISGEVTLQGIINQSAPGIKLQGQELPQDLWPYRVQNLDYSLLAEALQQEVFPFIVQLEPGSPYGFQISPIYFGLSADRHLGYAIQWFTMALATLIYYLVIHIRRIQV